MLKRCRPLENVVNNRPIAQHPQKAKRKKVFVEWPKSGVKSSRNKGTEGETETDHRQIHPDTTARSQEAQPLKPSPSRLRTETKKASTRMKVENERRPSIQMHLDRIQLLHLTIPHPIHRPQPLPIKKQTHSPPLLNPHRLPIRPSQMLKRRMRIRLNLPIR